jgi:CheY-like chemotaxis protein
MPERTPTVLIIDDEIDMRMLVRVVIDMAHTGLAVVGEAADGPEGIEVWRSLNGPPVPDVIVLDNRMPLLSGLEVAELILHERPEQKIVLFSAFLDEEVRRSAKAVGISACVTKEDASQLPELIQGLLADRRNGTDG